MNAIPTQDERLLFDPTAPDPDAIELAFAFPNTYSVGITSLGYQTVWATFAARSDLSVSRLFTDASDPLPSDLEILGFSLSWELDYVNILEMLESRGIAVRATDRLAASRNAPLIFGGGPVLTANPEPFADFFDVILMGDGEVSLPAFIDAYKEVRDADRDAQLRHLARVPGLYVPSLYKVRYETPDGPIAAIEPVDADIPASVVKQTHKSNTLLASSVVTERAAWPDIFMVEVVRSCPEMCRFCLASYLTLPFRVADLEGSLLPAIERGLEVTPRLGLLGASITQHPQFETILDYIGQPKYDDVRLSIASVRTNTVTRKLADVLSRRDTRSITIAVESGSARLRKVVNKKLATDEIAQAAESAKAGGLKALKLYGMVGIPGEVEEDVDATVEMMRSLKKDVPGLRLTLGCSTFVPKSHTPFQWFGVSKKADKRLKRLQKELRSKGIEFRPESYNWSVIQALISRGDRRLSHLLEKVRGYGDTLGSYKRAFKDMRGEIPPLEDYACAEYDRDRVLPWQHLDGPVSVAVLKTHLAQSEEWMSPEVEVVG